MIDWVAGFLMRLLDITDALHAKWDKAVDWAIKHLADAEEQ